MDSIEEYSSTAIKVFPSPNRSERLQAIIDKNTQPHSPMAKQGKEKDAEPTPSVSFVESGFFAQAIDTLTGIADSFFPDEEIPSKGEKDMLLNTTADTTDTESDKEDSLPTDRTFKPVQKSKSEESKNYGMPPPPMLPNSGTEMPSLVASNIHRPIPIATSRERTASSVYDYSTPGDDLRRTAPMARMRQDEDTTRSIEARNAKAKDPEVAKSRPASDEIEADEAVTEKHRKWRRQIQQRRRREQARKYHLSCGGIPPPSQGPSDVISRLFGNTGRSCGTVADVLYEASSSDESADPRESHSTRTDSRRYESSDSDSDDDSMQSRQARPKPHRETETLSAAKASQEATAISDKNFIKEFIAQTSTEGLSLIWHHPQVSKSYTDPERVNAQLKLGVAGPHGGYNAPRFAWHPNKSDQNGGSVDLFDIQSLEKASHLQLEAYPFAMSGNSFVLSLSSGSSFVFEASSDVDAHRIIHGLRWVVARLSFNLIIGNQDVSCELLSIPQIGHTRMDERKSSQSRLDEIASSRAMDEVLNLLVDKSVAVATSHN